jgi:hypothetical protein
MCCWLLLQIVGYVWGKVADAIPTCWSPGLLPLLLLLLPLLLLLRDVCILNPLKVLAMSGAPLYQVQPFHIAATAVNSAAARNRACIAHCRCW